MISEDKVNIGPPSRLLLVRNTLRESDEEVKGNSATSLTILDLHLKCEYKNSAHAYLIVTISIRNSSWTQTRGDFDDNFWYFFQILGTNSRDTAIKIYLFFDKMFVSKALELYILRQSVGVYISIGKLKNDLRYFPHIIHLRLCMIWLIIFPIYVDDHF